MTAVVPLLPTTTGSLRVAQFIASHKPFVAFGNVPVADNEIVEMAPRYQSVEVQWNGGWVAVGSKGCTSTIVLLPSSFQRMPHGLVISHLRQTHAVMKITARRSLLAAMRQNRLNNIEFSVD